MSIGFNFFSAWQSRFRLYESKPFKWRGMKDALTYEKSTDDYNKGRIGNQTISVIEYEVKVYQRSNLLSRGIMNVVYQTEQKVKWLNYQKNKEAYEKAVREKLSADEQQLLKQQSYNPGYSMIESLLYPLSTSPLSSTNESVEGTFIAKFKAWSEKIFAQHLNEIKNLYLSEKKTYTERVLNKEKYLSKKRQDEYEKQINLLRNEARKNHTSNELIEKCIEQCKQKFFEQNKLLNQNIELLVALQPTISNQVTQKAYQNIGFLTENNNRELVVGNNNAEKEMRDAAGKARPKGEEPAVLNVTVNMSNEDILKDVKDYTAEIKSTLNDLYEKICINIFHLHFQFHAPSERTEKEINIKKELNRLLEEVRKLFLNGFKKLHPDKIIHKFSEEKVVIQGYQEGFIALQDYQSKFSDLTKYIANPRGFASDIKVVALLTKHNLMIHSNLAQDRNYILKKNLEDLEKQVREFTEETERTLKEHREAVKLMYARFEKQQEEFEAKLAKENEEQNRKIEALTKQVEALMRISSSQTAQTTSIGPQPAVQKEESSSPKNPRLSTSRDSFYAEKCPEQPKQASIPESTPEMSSENSAPGIIPDFAG